ncbi:MAG TPA: 2-phosphosulfolactate phosphatase [Candidatus Limnocylindria bacterium]|jgi:2-phosphosulfolactate phosphatase|nr:2-phosphosulfolactate phosphatase [Candidatus Limnocylindria bacterium]
MRKIEVTFGPPAFPELRQRCLNQATCVVFDVLRATSTMLEALSNGANAIFPAEDIPNALALKTQHPTALLAGERHGLRIGKDQTGGVDFDLGNSPREFTARRVAGRKIIMTTTNGTRALAACRHAGKVLIGSFANLGAMAAHLTFALPEELILVCSGTGEQTALEDALGAGALVDRLWPHYEDRSLGKPDDSAVMVRELYRATRKRLAQTIGESSNGRRLLSMDDLKADVPLCLEADRLDVIATLHSCGAIQVWE